MKQLFITLLTTITLFATAQFGDYMIINGKKQEIFTNPLEPYLREHKAAAFKSVGVCSACWRGYQATWEIIDGYLYIIALQECSCSPNDRPIPLKKIFPNLKGDKLKAAWFSGEIRIPQGKRLEYLHLGYMSRYEKDLFIRFEKGKLINRRIVDNRAKVND